MKLNKIFSAFMLVAAVAFTACNDNPPVIGPNGGDDDKPDTPDTAVVDTTGWNIPAGTLTVAQARELCSSLGTDVASDKEYYVMGYVQSADVSGVQQYGNVSAYMVDKKGDTSEESRFYAYRVKGLNGQAIKDEEAVKEGDFIVVYGKLINFKGNTPETSGSAYIWKSSNPKMQGEDIELIGDGSEEKPYSVAEVMALNNTKSGKYYVKGYIVGQVKGGSQAMDDAEFAAPFTATENGNNTNILIAATATASSKEEVVPVQLPSGALRDGLNLIQNESLLGQEILIYGSLEIYFLQAGIKNPSYAKVGDKELGTKPVPTTGDEVLNEGLNTAESFAKFTAISVKGDEVWSLETNYGGYAKMSGYTDGATKENEDWLISPAMDLTGKSAANLTFNQAFGPVKSLPLPDENQYTIWVSNDFDGDVTTATWTQLKGTAYTSTKGWEWLSSGEMAIPAENLKANCRIAWKYTCTTVSATWEIKEVVVK